METEERIAYLRNTLRQAPQGSARRIWAEAQLKALEAVPECTAEAQRRPLWGRAQRTNGRKS